MVCVSCGRGADPTRSFCRYCGSAVFAAPDEVRRQQWRQPTAVIGAEAGPNATEGRDAQRPAPAVRRIGRGAVRTRRSATGTPPAVNAIASAIGAVVRLIIFVVIVWTAGRWMLSVPEVRNAADALTSGDEAAFSSAVDQLKTRFQSWARDSSGNRPAPTSPAAGDGAAADPVIYKAGPGIVTPMPTYRETPQYTPEAMRQKIEGTVLLSCVVHPDSTVSDIEVVRSLDRVYGLDDQAVGALSQWRFTPGRRNGRDVAVRVSVEMTFRLK